LLLAVLRPERSSPCSAPLPAPLFADTAPAHNPAQLTVLVDPVKLVGWIGGSKDQAGQEVQITADGRTHAVRVEAGNSFVWHYEVARPTPADVAVAGFKRRIVLQPPGAAAPTAFFIVDRPVYRPNQSLQFAAYLRQPDARGEFRSMPRREVEVHLTSLKKKTTAARMRLTADHDGRVAGSYTFVDGDALDTYELTVPDFKGAARVDLAEYRKSKIKLEISGKRAGDRVRLHFAAMDFLGKPVPGGKVHFTAQVVRNPARTEPGDLKPSDFVYADDALPAALTLENLGEDEQLVLRAGLNHLPALGAGGPVVISHAEGEVALDGERGGVHVLTLPRKWKEGRHAVVVQGVLTDPNGHEQRATHNLPLGADDDTLRLSLPRDVFTTNEPIRVTARYGDNGDLGDPATLVALRLAPNPASGAMDPYSGYLGNSLQLNVQSINWGYNLPPYAWRYGRRMRPWRGEPIEVEEPLRRTMVTATTFRDGVAILRLAEPGAYKLVAMLERPDRSQVRQEIGCVVHTAEDRPPLALRLDRTALEAGERLHGFLHSRFADARVLLTVRDADGYRTWKTLQLKKGVAEIKLELPADCRYGCFVDAQYADADDESPHIVSAFIHVRPTGRMLTIQTKMKPVVGPGDTVDIDVKVNRKEVVDLVVSVYDQSLLGIKSDRSVDPRSFYLADERARHSQAREVLRRKLGGVTIGQLLDRAGRLLKQYSDNDGAEEPVALRTLLQRVKTDDFLYTYDIATLLRLAGVKLQPVNVWYGAVQWSTAGRERREIILTDLIEGEANGWRLHFLAFNDTVVMVEHHASWGPRHNPALYSYSPWLNLRGGGGGYVGNGIDPPSRPAPTRCSRPRARRCSPTAPARWRRLRPWTPGPIRAVCWSAATFPTRPTGVPWCAPTPRARPTSSSRCPIR
jgi:hypothetical protein